MGIRKTKNPKPLASQLQITRKEMNNQNPKKNTSTRNQARFGTYSKIVRKIFPQSPHKHKKVALLLVSETIIWKCGS